jgi:hypothetical protein
MTSECSRRLISKEASPQSSCKKQQLKCLHLYYCVVCIVVGSFASKSMEARYSGTVFSGHSPSHLVIPLFRLYFDAQRIGQLEHTFHPPTIQDLLTLRNNLHQKSESKQNTMSNNNEFEHEKENRSLSSESASLSSGTGTETNHTGVVSNDSSISIARAETKAVNRSKIVVLVVIAIAATACGAATYFFTKSEEEDDFHSQVRRD